MKSILKVLVWTGSAALLLAFPGAAGAGCPGDLPCWECPDNCPDSCPCWTAAELAAIRVDDCSACGNWIQVGGPPAAEPSCVHINGVTRDDGITPACQWGGPFLGWVGVWDQAPLLGLSPPGCFIYDIVEGIDPARKVSSLTPAQEAACVADIVARGTANALANPGYPYGCMGQCFPPQCELQVIRSRCSNDLSPCLSDSDCLFTGACSVDLQPCFEPGGCPPIGLCALNSEPCYSNADCPKTCSQTHVPCVDETACPGPLNNCIATACGGINPQVCFGLSEGTCQDSLVFTHQGFDVVTGLATELTSDGDFTGAQCEGVLTPVLSPVPSLLAIVADPAAPPPPGDSRYYLTRAVEGVSCVDHADSSLEPDPRDLLDATCP